MPSSNITALLAEANGDVWIGYVSGDISRLHRGRLATAKIGLRNAAVFQITRDADGVVWAALKSAQHGGIARFTHGRWTLLGRDFGLPEGSATSILASRDGAIWVNFDGVLFVRRHGDERFVATGDRLRKISCITEAPDGDIWVSSDAAGLPRRVGLQPDGAAAEAGLVPLHVPPAPEPEVGRMIIDRDGALWGTYEAGGVFRITRGARSPTVPPSHGSSPERFALTDGLSSDIARPLLEDREGNIWVGTNLGLDRFRATNIVAASGVPATSRRGFVAAPGIDGAIFVATGDTLYIVRADRKATALAHLPVPPTFLYVDRQAVLWVGLDRGLSRLEQGGLQPVPLPAAATGMTAGWMQDDSGSTCIAVLRRGVFCGTGRGWQQSDFQLADALLSPQQMLRDRKGRIWLDFGDELAVLDHGSVRRFSAADGLTVGKIGLIADGPSGLLVGGDFGLARYDGRRFVTLDAERHPQLSRLTGIVENAGDTWLNGIKGVVKISDMDLNAAFGNVTQPIAVKVYDMKDGLPGVAQQDSDTPTAIAASDGRLWFVTSHGVAWLDPTHLVRNPVPPPVSIRSITANGTEYPYPEALELAAGSSNVEIDYTALSLSVPERVHFRYRLDGVDDAWIDPGTRRQAFYTKLGPGKYRFRVIAANNDGVWNMTGAAVDFSLPPTFVQSIWFKLVLAACGLAAIWLLYSLRVRQLTERLRGRLEERLGERERIARELHDTLLQGFQGLVYRFQAAAERLPPGSAVRQMIETALDQADEVLIDGRNRVFDLRTDAALGDISDVLAIAAKRLLTDSATSFRIIVEGKPRRLHPIAHEEILRIGEEALSNAVRHARAETIEVSIVYRHADFKLHVRDNGTGIGLDILAAGGKGHHFGMTGMRERAETIKATFTISSHLAAGTEITLSIPGTTAYARPTVARTHRFPSSNAVEVSS